MKKSKGQTIDLLYTNKKETNKKSKDVRANSSRMHKNKKTNSNKKKTKKTQNNGNEIINLDNEIIIGLTRKEEPKKTKKIKKQTNKSKNIKKSTAKNVGKNSTRPKKNDKNNSKKKKKQNSKKKTKIRVIKWVILILLLLTAIVLFMMSSVFNIKAIVVINNSKVPSEEIINLSSLTTGINMFKIRNGIIRNNIKSNAYIEDVEIKRSINGTVTLDIKERQATYMLGYANNYVFINNQGYILEISENPAEIPTLIGFSTPNEDIKVGNRLNNEDLNKLDDIIKIVETSKNTPLANIITIIDISDSMDYKLTVGSEKKTVRLGEMNNINIKLQMVGQVFTAEKGKSGEIYFQEDGKKAIFKEEVSR